MDRVTAVATHELSSTPLTVAARRIARLVESGLAQRLDAAATAFTSAIRDAAPGRIDHLDDALATYLAALRDAAAAARRAVPATSSDPRAAAARSEAIAALEEVADTCIRILTSFQTSISERSDVVWLAGDDSRGLAQLRVAPLSVASLLRTGLFDRATAVLTSATLAPGGSFEAIALQWGLSSTDAESRWRGIDVGSPFEHAKSGILYVARTCRRPGGTAPAQPSNSARSRR